MRRSERSGTKTIAAAELLVVPRFSQRRTDEDEDESGSRSWQKRVRHRTRACRAKFSSELASMEPCACSMQRWTCQCA
eukprot:6194493-Pleurochrysis_carterae.AAC.2